MKKFCVSFFVVLLSLLVPLSSLAGDENQVVTGKSGGTLFYDANGGVVQGISTLGDGGSIVEMRKIIEDVEDAENLFDITLQVRTTQQIEKLKNISPDAAVTLILDISSSMRECVKCGHNEDNSCHNFNGDCDYRASDAFTTRMDATKAAASSFVTSFASMGIEPGVNPKPKRLVSIITFDATAKTLKLTDHATHQELYYLDVAASTENLSEVTTTLSSLTTGSGTNIEGGMLLAANLETHFFAADKPYQNVDYLYTILLTDGEPYRGVSNSASTNSIDEIKGSTYNNSELYVDNVGTHAATIKNLSSLSKIYSICLGVEGHGNTGNSTMSLKPFDDWPNANPATTDDMTIGTWLGLFSNGGVFGDITSANAGSILSNFNSVLSQMQLAAKAWEVRDTMGPYADFVIPLPVDGVTNDASVTNDVLTWKLVSSSADPTISREANNILGYTYKYRVRLNNLPEAYTGTPSDTHRPNSPETPANTSAVLDYAVEDSTGNWALVSNKPFMQPYFYGFTGSLSFKKINTQGETLPGMEFSLYADGVDAPIRTVTSDAQGIVTLNNIPSGHSYRLAETATVQYTNLADITFTISYGDLEDLNATLQTDEETGGYVAVNKIAPHSGNPMNIRINKVFKVVADDDNIHDVPPSVYQSVGATSTFKITHLGESPDNSGITFTLYRNNDNERLTQTQPGISEETHVITELSSSIQDYEWLYTEVSVQTDLGADGIDLTDTSTSEASISEDKKTVTLYPKLEANQSKTYVVTYTNYFEQHAGTITVNKAYRRHDIATSTCSGSATIDPGDYENAVVYIDLYAADGVTWITSRPLDNTTGTVSFVNVPLGKYVVRERSPSDEINPSNLNVIEKHEWAHGLFTSYQKNSAPAQSINFNAVTDGYSVALTADGDAVTLDLENHYDPHNARLSVSKEFSFDDLPDNMKPDSYFTQLTGTSSPAITVTVKDSNGETVDELILNAEGNWNDLSIPLPLGTYTLEETVQDLPGYTLTASRSSTVEITSAFHHKQLHHLFTNTYTRKTGSLTITKLFENHKEEFKNRSIAVYVRRADKSLYNTVLLNENHDGQWSTTLNNVPWDAYELAEEITKGDENTAYLEEHAITSMWSDPGYNITMADWSNGNGAISRTVTNAYADHEHQVRITKAYTVDGKTAAMPADYTVTITLIGVDPTTYADIPGAEYRSSMLTRTHPEHIFSLARGVYRIEETAYGENSDYQLSSISVTLAQNDHVDIIEMDGKHYLHVKDAAEEAHDPLDVTLANNYEKKPVVITVDKSFAGDLRAELFQQTVFEIEIYDDDDNLVDTLELKLIKNAAGEVDHTLSFYDESIELDADKTYRLVEKNWDTITNYVHKAVWLLNNREVSDTHVLSNLQFSPGTTAQISLVNHFDRQTTNQNAVTILKHYEIPGLTDEQTAEMVSGKSSTVIFKPNPPLEGMQDQYLVLLPDTQVQTFALDVGEYFLYEDENAVAQIPNYTFDRENMTLTVMQIDDGLSSFPVLYEKAFADNPIKVEVNANTTLQITVTNPYTPNPGTITLVKRFEGYTALPGSVTFTFTDVANKQNTISVVLEGSAFGESHVWMKEIELPVGTYTVEETVTDQLGNMQRVVSTWSGLDAVNQFVVTPGAVLTLECKNRLETALSAYVPFKKTIALGGDLPAPAGTVFRFEVDVQPASKLISVAPAGSRGSITRFDGTVDTERDVGHYLMEIAMDQTGELEGYLELIAFEDHLAETRVTISETLHPFENEADALASGWTYDAVQYTATFESKTPEQVVCVICDQNNSAADAAAFSNIYTQFMPADFPQTGDRRPLILWLAVFTISSAALMHLRRRRNS